MKGSPVIEASGTELLNVRFSDPKPLKCSESHGFVCVYISYICVDVNLVLATLRLCNVSQPLKNKEVCTQAYIPQKQYESDDIYEARRL